MNVSQQIIEVLNALSEKVGVAIDWTSENILPQLKIVCEHFIRYKLITTGIGVGIATLSIIVSIIVALYILSQYNSFIRTGQKNLFFKFDSLNACRVRDITIFVLVAAGVFSVIGLGCLFCNVPILIQCIVCPELVILDYLKNMLGGV